MRTIRLRITMRDVEPCVVRVIDVPGGVTLAELHGLLQVALGWTDSHLHVFEADGGRYGVPDPDWEDDLRPRDEATVRLRELPARFAYLYDFGDGWEHDIEVLGSGEETPGCVRARAGARPRTAAECRATSICSGCSPTRATRSMSTCTNGRASCRPSTGTRRAC